LRSRTLTFLAAATMTLSAAPVVAQDEAPSSAAPTAPVALVDIVDQLPTTLDGIAAETEVIRGLEHIDGFDPSVEADAEQIASLEEFVTSLGASVEDMTSASAVAIDGEELIFMAGIQVAGADPEAILESYIETLLGQMVEPSQELGEIGGKLAIRIVDQAFEDEQPVYVYGIGPVVWLLVASEPGIGELLEQLP
jgi:hypothetical protein